MPEKFSYSRIVASIKAMQMNRNTAHPGKVYRFFENQDHADALANGNVWLSTLESCRRAEGDARRDEHEGRIEIAIDNLNSDRVNDRHLIAQHFGEGAANGKGIVFEDCVISRTLSDAYVICATERYGTEEIRASFGRHCVEILMPGYFQLLVSEQLSRVRPLREAVMGPVTYRNSAFPVRTGPGVPLGFVKRSDKYEGQQEFRFLWTVEDGVEIAPFQLHVPKVSAICRRL